MSARSAVPMLAAALLVVACERAETKPPAAAPVGPGQVDWAHRSFTERMDYMKSTVLPVMGHEFHAFDAEAYQAPACTTCHRSGAKDGSFKMPDVGLPPLPADPQALHGIVATEPAMFDFMAKTVVPKMAGLLGEPPYDPRTRTGFGCFACHTKG